MKSGRHRLILYRLAGVIALLLCLLLLPQMAWARAGGGGGFGGGDGGGGGSDGGGGGALIYWLIWLCIHHPFVGIPVVVAVVFFVIVAGKQGNEARITHTIRRGTQRQQQGLLAAGTNAIQVHDPAFDQSQFLARAGTAFHRIQEAWSRQQIASVRPFISDGVHERFSLQVKLQQAEGIRNVLEDVTILSSDMAAIFTDPQFDTLHVRFHASAVDYEASLDSGRKTSGTKQSEEFIEIWSFHRRPGVKSLQGPGAIEGQCPRCGSPLPIIDQAKCGACGAQVNSGEFDWVLAEITQESEWSVPGSERTVNGLSEIRQADPGFSVQHIEDRVSVMFWRLRAAEAFRDMQLAAPVLSAKWNGQFAAALEEMQQSHRFWKGPAVGRVEIIDVTPAVDANFDRVRVKVRWSGTLREGDPAGSSKVVRQQAIYTDVYTLLRRRGTRSAAQSAFTSAGCPACGAPIAVNQSGDCDYCQTNITDGRYDWVLDDVSPYSADLAFLGRGAGNEGAESGVLPAISAPDDDAELSLAVLARVMYADGEVSAEERQALHRIGAHRRMPASEVDLLIQSAQVAETKIPEPRDSVEAGKHLRQIVHVVLADGNISRQEQKLISSYAEQVGLSAADVKLAIQTERRRMYQGARRVLKRPGPRVDSAG